MLAWLALIVIAATLVASSWRFPRFAFGAGAVLLVAALVYLAQDKLREPSAPAPANIPAELDDLSFSPGYTGSYNLSGRITNLSGGQMLEALRLHVALLDCPGTNDDGECVTIGETTAQVFKQVPPGQARDFTHNFHLGETRARGQVRWMVKILETTGGEYIK